MRRRINIGYLYLIIGLIGLGVTLFGPPPYPGMPPSIGAPLWKALQVPDRMARLTPGMSQAQAMAALGLTGCRVGPLMGSGASSHMWLTYQLRPQMTMGLTFDSTWKPGGAFVTGEVSGTDTQGLTAVCVWVLVAGVGFLWCLRFRRRSLVAGDRLAREHGSTA